jgi:deoxyadenosine/deoxycytidine kinase
MSPKIYSIEGNIGIGKSTILKNLKEYINDDDIIFLQEPVNMWEEIKDENGESIIKKFYENQKKYAFSFQILAYTTRLSILRDALNNNPNCKAIICERSLEADKNIFAKMLYDDDIIEEINYKIYEKFFDIYSEKYRIDGIIYLSSTAEICYDRILKRARNGENNIPLEYLQKCKKYHDEWLNNDNNINILKIDTTESVTYENDNGVEWLKNIHNFINN